MGTGTAFTDYAAKKVIDHITGTASYTAPAIYVGLFTVAPTDTGTDGTEVTGGSYAREGPETFDAASGSDPSLAANTNTITFTTATANWGTIVAVGLFDAASGGNLLMYQALDSSQTINSGGTFTFAAGALIVKLY